VQGRPPETRASGQPEKRTEATLVVQPALYHRGLIATALTLDGQINGTDDRNRQNGKSKDQKRPRKYKTGPSKISRRTSQGLRTETDLSRCSWHKNIPLFGKPEGVACACVFVCVLMQLSSLVYWVNGSNTQNMRLLHAWTVVELLFKRPLEIRIERAIACGQETSRAKEAALPETATWRRMPIVQSARLTIRSRTGLRHRQSKHVPKTSRPCGSRPRSRWIHRHHPSCCSRRRRRIRSWPGSR